jgi:hypothetical protein
LARGVEEKGEMIYFIREQHTNFVKIGFTSGETPEARRSALQTGNPRKLVVIAVVDGDEQRERELHRRYWENKTEGGDEWFALTDEQIKLIVEGGLNEQRENHPRPIAGDSSFDVRPLRWRQYDAIAGGRKVLPRRATAFDHSGNQPVFVTLRGKH